MVDELSKLELEQQAQENAYAQELGREQAQEIIRAQEESGGEEEEEDELSSQGGRFLLAYVISLANDLIDYFVIGSIPILGDTIDIFTDFSLFLIFSGLPRAGGSNYTKILTEQAIAAVVELVPFGDLIPTYTILTTVVYIQYRAATRGGLAAKALNVANKLIEENKEKEGETKPDALEELNNKDERTDEDNKKLVQARQILNSGVISDEQMNDPVLKAAWEHNQRGEAEYDPVTGNGFKFSNTVYASGHNVAFMGNTDLNSPPPSAPRTPQAPS